MVQPSYRAELTALLQGYGILGKAGHTLRCRQAIPLARAFGDLLAPDGGGTFAIGHDVRTSSPSIAEAVSLGLRSGGHHAIHIGTCTRPQLEWYVADAGLHGALMITGGCAPPEWNGIRLHGAHAEPIYAENVLAALEIYDLNELFSTPCNPVLRHARPQPAYAAWLRQRLRPQRYVKLCLDTGNGLAGAEFESIVAHYRQLRLWRIGFTPDPAFPTRGPDPFSPHACASLAEYVIANGCDLGAALDADGVHLAVTDEHGQRLTPHTLGILLALALASECPSLRVFHHGDLSAHAARALRRAGVEIRSLNSGPRTAWSALHDSGHPGFYFDHEGHYAFSDFPGTANAMLALITLINHLTGSDSTLSALAQSVDAAPAT